MGDVNDITPTLAEPLPTTWYDARFGASAPLSPARNGAGQMPYLPQGGNPGGRSGHLCGRMMRRSRAGSRVHLYAGADVELECDGFLNYDRSKFTNGLVNCWTPTQNSSQHRRPRAKMLLYEAMPTPGLLEVRSGVRRGYRQLVRGRDRVKACRPRRACEGEVEQGRSRTQGV